MQKQKLIDQGLQSDVFFGGFQVTFLEVAVCDLHLSDPKVTWQLGIAWNMGPVRMGP